MGIAWVPRVWCGGAVANGGGGREGGEKEGGGMRERVLPCEGDGGGERERHVDEVI